MDYQAEGANGDVAIKAKPVSYNELCQLYGAPHIGKLTAWVAFDRKKVIV